MGEFLTPELCKNKSISRIQIIKYLLIIQLQHYYLSLCIFNLLKLYKIQFVLLCNPRGFYEIQCEIMAIECKHFIFRF